MSVPGAYSKGGDTVYQQLVTGQTTITTGATLIVAASTGAIRGKVSIANATTNVGFYYGADTSLTTTNGAYMAPNAQQWMNYSGALYGIVASGTCLATYASLEGA